MAAEGAEWVPEGVARWVPEGGAAGAPVGAEWWCGVVVRLMLRRGSGGSGPVAGAS